MWTMRTVTAVQHSRSAKQNRYNVAYVLLTQLQFLVACITADGLLLLHNYYYYCRGADKSLARPGRKEATETKLLTSANHSKTIQKVVRPTRSPQQQ